jgi:hypothetical protein
MYGIIPNKSMQKVDGEAPGRFATPSKTIFREVGRKFGRWLDLVFMQRFLDAAGAPRHR